jgi:hypothetical protein
MLIVGKFQPPAPPGKIDVIFTFAAVTHDYVFYAKLVIVVSMTLSARAH